jgi:D-alanyl-lipoteichoic acid acyltransferase DltB (MBOAT superfamily)
LKYLTFTISPLCQILGVDLDLSIISKLIIPVGVSFFTLQGIGYLINVKMGWEKPETSFFYFLLYITFFPKFLSGPIERSNLFLPQIRVDKKYNEKRISDGFKLVLFGLFKKIVIANQLAIAVNSAYMTEGSTKNSLLIILFIQPIYLYFDFSGYTDIAIGISRALGIDLLPNFKNPFLAENITNFWKRFHISLSSWFHDYVFMRTIFKVRKWGKKATTFALFVTWLLFGIWHGAGWTFMFLGLLQAFAIYFEYSTKKLRTKVFRYLPQFYRKWVGRIFTYIFYGVSLVFFFAPSLDSSFEFLSKLFIFNGLVPKDIDSGPFIVALTFSFVILIFEVIQTDFHYVLNKIETYWKTSGFPYSLLRWVIYYFMIAAILFFINGDKQFVYLKF